MLEYMTNDIVCQFNYYHVYYHGIAIRIYYQGTSDDLTSPLLVASL